MIKEKILFIGDDSHWSHTASRFLVGQFRDVEVIFWDYGTPRPTEHIGWCGDRIFTFRADLILDPALLSRASKSAMNFHPSIPNYRGIGGYHYAIADGRKMFGVTCHHLTAEIDAGPIIAVRRFAIAPNETVNSLMERTASYALNQFYEITYAIITGRPLPAAPEEKWGHTLFTRTMLAEGTANFHHQPDLRTG